MLNHMMTTQPLGKALLYNEHHMSKADFSAWLSDAVDDENPAFLLSSVAVPDGFGEKHYRVIMSKRAAARHEPADAHGNGSPFAVAMSILENPLFGLQVAKTKVRWDDDPREAAPDNDLGMLNTVILNKRDDYAVVFECTNSYIRIVTVSSPAGDFFVKPSDYVIEIDKYGAITTSATFHEGPTLEEALQQMEDEDSLDLSDDD